MLLLTFYENSVGGGYLGRDCDKQHVFDGCVVMYVICCFI